MASPEAAIPQTDAQAATQALQGFSDLLDSVRMGDRRQVGDIRIGNRDALDQTGALLQPLREPNSDVMRRIEAGEQIAPTARTLDNYRDLLRNAGVNNPDQLARETLTRLERLFAHLPESERRQAALGQMERMTRAMSEILTGSRGQGDPLGTTERRNMVIGLALRMSNPERWGNQGNHNTCALQSFQRLLMQGRDPARIIEQAAMVANMGYATFNGRRVEVDPRSLIPDSESRIDPQSRLVNGRIRDGRDMGGHVIDALLGQFNADLQGPNRIYMAANAHLLGQLGERNTTGEAQFVRLPNGTYRVESNCPNVSLLDSAILARALGLPEGSVVAHESLYQQTLQIMARESPETLARFNADPAIQRMIQRFSSAQDLRSHLRNLETGHSMSGFLAVNASHLPEGAMQGHALHALLIALNSDGSFRLDNNWGDNHDRSLISDAQVLLATDLNQWGRGSPGPGPGPDLNPDRSDLPPNRQEPDDFIFDNGDKRGSPNYPENVRERRAQVERELNEERQRDRSIENRDRVQREINVWRQAHQQFEQEYAAWRANPQGPPPSFDLILYMWRWRT